MHDSSWDLLYVCRDRNGCCQHPRILLLVTPEAGAGVLWLLRRVEGIHDLKMYNANPRWSKRVSKAPTENLSLGSRRLVPAAEMDYSAHFSINNIPYGIASDHAHPERMAVTRLGNSVIYLADLELECPIKVRMALSQVSSDR